MAVLIMWRARINRRRFDKPIIAFELGHEFVPGHVIRDLGKQFEQIEAWRRAKVQHHCGGWIAGPRGTRLPSVNDHDSLNMVAPTAAMVCIFLRQNHPE